MKKIITPRIFRSIYNRAIIEIILKGLKNYQHFMTLGIQPHFFTDEDYIALRNMYQDVYSLLTHNLYKDVDNS